MTKQQRKWNADAAAAMMGFTVAVESEEHLTHMTGYVIHTLSGMLDYPIDEDEKTKEVVFNATQKYNSSKDKSVKWFTVNNTSFGTCLTFVRDKGALTLKSGKMKNSGSLAWVENLEYPDGSELGYVYFECVNGRTRRVA